MLLRSKSEFLWWGWHTILILRNGEPILCGIENVQQFLSHIFIRIIICKLTNNNLKKIEILILYTNSNQLNLNVSQLSEIKISFSFQTFDSQPHLLHLKCEIIYLCCGSIAHGFLGSSC